MAFIKPPRPVRAGHSAQQKTNWLLGFIPLVIGTAMIVFGISQSNFLVFIGALVFAVGTIPIFQRLRMAVGGWQPATVQFDHWPLHLGETATVTYERLATKTQMVTHATLTAELKCVERATYRRGTDTHTAKETVTQLNFQGSCFFDGTKLICQLPIQIPTDKGAPTMDLGNNEIKWTLKLKTSGDNVLSDSYSQDIIVAAELKGGQHVH